MTTLPTYESLRLAAELRWNSDMKMPEEGLLGRPAMELMSELSSQCFVGSGTIEDPRIVWLGLIPCLPREDPKEVPEIDNVQKKANENIARIAAQSIGCSHVYIRCTNHSTKLVYMDGKRVALYDQYGRQNGWETMPADPHLTLLFGMSLGTVCIHGHATVRLDENKTPIDFASTRIPELVVDGDDRILELFRWIDPMYCYPYCPVHGKDEVMAHQCEVARPHNCPHHDSPTMLDHYCPQTQWGAKDLVDHYCPCEHNTEGLLDHWCPCPHTLDRRDDHYCPCPHDVEPGTDHYCPCPHRLARDFLLA
ncbi:Uu.00g145130.m01.CDS01 [Anthostomella pinea]|uniref:Uu.00g145130.m01.CDS01 n=1 Tax=Anthostomella pinea TaxID=933095 RepID=A0AAI8VR04_9PEZI|nr:Uu.00g145130.m01.CDS01 [Anthostomella pinea]